MKLKVLIPSILAMAVMTYCSPKVGQEVKQTPTIEKAPDVAVHQIHRSTEEFENGKAIMAQSCKKCHVLFDPQDYKVEEWEKILKVMIPKARLSETDAALVKDYIIAHAQDYNK